MEVLNVNLGAELKAIRQKSLLSQEAFAKELGVSFTSVNRWETGKSTPSYKAMKQINDFCKTHNIDYDITHKLMETNGEH